MHTINQQNTNLEPVYVVGAVVSCKTRHKQDRHTRTVQIAKTDLSDHSYANIKNIVARDRVREALHALGFKSTYEIKSWIYSNQQEA